MMVAVVLLLIAVCGATAQSVWPMPQVFNTGSITLSISPVSFQFKTSSNNMILNAAIERYSQLLFPFGGNNPTSGPALKSVTITITGPGGSSLQFGVDESYTLQVSANNGQLQAKTVFGALRGLETFSQLVTCFNYSDPVYSIQGTPISIKDAPRFPWRGLLIDSSRHFLTVDAIKTHIDAMSYAKLNTLHWHITDAESFPIQSTTYPLLSQKGAYDPAAVYTPDDVNDIIQYALERGIRVVPEFDMPGHAASWHKAYPQLTVYCHDYMDNINNIPLDPTQDFTYEVLDGFLTEMAQRFGDDFLHLGGDEVVLGCWGENSAIMQWMRQHNIPNTVQLEQYFETKLQGIVAQINKTMVTWQELFNNGITMPMNTVVEVWKDSVTLQEVVQAGYRGLLAYPWYLDKQIPKDNSYHYEWEDTWKDFYTAEPLSGITVNQNLVIGGEACMWGEQVDSTNAVSRVWPRAAAAAERLWSAKSVTDTGAALPRLAEFRCHSLAQRSIPAGPVMPDYCPIP